MSKSKKEENNTYRTIQFVVKNGHPLNEYFMDMMYKSNNLYNATNFHLRQLWTALKLEEGKPIHPLQQEVVDLFKSTIPKVNKNNTEKFYKLVKQDVEKAVIFNKPRKLTRFNMPTKDNSFCSYELMDAVFKTSKNRDYKSLPSHVNQGVMKQVYNDWSSFFEGVKEYKVNPSKFKGRPKPPRYKTKDATNSVVFSNQVCKIKDSKYLRFPKTKEVFNLSKHLLQRIDNNKLVQVRVQKFYNDVKLEVVLDCSSEAKPLIPKEDIQNVMAIDLGVNNLATCVSNNGMQPTIINGRALKSINQYYNKLRAKLYSDLRLNKKPDEGNFTSKRLEYIDMKRHFKVKDFLHKASKQVVDLAIANNIDKVIVGYNSSWKEDVEMKKDDKQSFVNIPFSTFLDMLEYKLNAEGIHFEKFEESYTSKASFLDNDPIPTYGDKDIPKFSGKRVKRGLYISKNGIAINSDVNGACNILRKHFNKDIKISYKILSNVRKINIKNGSKKLKSTLNILLNTKELSLI